MSIILTRSKPSPSNTGGISLPTSSVDVDPGLTEAVDSVVNSFRLVKWLVIVDELVGGRNVTYEVVAHRRPNGTTLFTQYAILGDRIQHTVSVVDTGTDIELRVQNNIANILRVLATRIHAEP